MSMGINTNITSMIGQQNLSESKSALTTSMERLSSGLRINSAKDDAAGQAIANRMSSQITGLSQAQRNANDGISVAQTAEGALNQVNDNLQRVRELTVQAQNGTNNQEDLTSIQNEIGQRLNEINRISEETDFNGVKVLQSDNSLQIQVGANDGQSISIDLKQINAQTLGLDGFNVDGTGVTQNKAATVTDLTAAGATGTGPYTVTTTHDAATFDDVMSNIEDGNTVAVGGGSTYTYEASSNSFTFDNTLDTTDATARGNLAADITPSTGATSGTYELSGGDKASFEVDATGKLTIDGQDAYITATGELTNNDPSGTATAATMDDLLADMGGQSGAKLNIGGTEYEQTAADTLTFKDSASVSDVESALAGAGSASTVTLGSGIQSASIAIGAGSTTSTDTYVDGDSELTTTASYDTEYEVDPNNGEVTVSGGTGTGKYAADVGAQTFVSSDGDLTTSETSAGDKTEDPLAALDSALSSVDALRSDLGAIQNRFDSAITNLSTTETNITAARSRIEDADYATEVADMTKNQILQQAGTSVLAQANQLPQSVLSLLG